MSLTFKRWKSGWWQCLLTGRYHSDQQLKNYELAGFNVQRHY